MKTTPIRIGTLLIVAAVVISFLLIAYFLYALQDAFKDDGKAMVGTTSDVRSPDMQWIATLETVDNGLGFGQGMLFDEIHIRRPNERILDHGDTDDSSVFYIDSMGQSNHPPRIRWDDSTHLIVTYAAAGHLGTGPGKSVRNFRGVSIEYKIEP